jgi:hypothetical protein
MLVLGVAGYWVVRRVLGGLGLVTLEDQTRAGTLSISTPHPHEAPEEATSGEMKEKGAVPSSAWIFAHQALQEARRHPL